jgi:hypothetical protein
VAAEIRGRRRREGARGGLIEVHVLTCMRTYSDASCRCSGCGAPMDAAALSSILPRGRVASFGISDTRRCESDASGERADERERKDRTFAFDRATTV